RFFCPAGGRTLVFSRDWSSDVCSSDLSELMSLVDTINESNGVARDAITTNANYQAALEGLNDLVEKNGTSLDQSTASGSANAAADRKSVVQGKRVEAGVTTGEQLRHTT